MIPFTVGWDAKTFQLWKRCQRTKAFEWVILLKKESVQCNSVHIEITDAVEKTNHLTKSRRQIDFRFNKGLYFYDHYFLFFYH